MHDRAGSSSRAIGIVVLILSYCERFTKRKKDESGQLIEIELTIHQYYEMQYNIPLWLPNLPCIAAGRAKKPTYISVEVCKYVLYSYQSDCMLLKTLNSE